MKVKPFLKKKQQKPETLKGQMPKQPQSAKAENKTEGRSNGSRFNVLREEETNKTFNTQSENIKKKGTDQVWRKKESTNYNPFEKLAQAKTRWEIPPSNFSFGETSKVRRDIGTESDVMEAVSVGAAEREMAQHKKVKKTRHVTQGNLNGTGHMEVGQKEHSSPTTLIKMGRKRRAITRPRMTSPLLKKKQQSRAHVVIFGSEMEQKALNFNEDTLPAEEGYSQEAKGNSHSNKQHHHDVENHIHPGDHVSLIPPQPPAPPDPNGVEQASHSSHECPTQKELWFDPQEEVKMDQVDEPEAIELSASGQ